MFTVFKLQATNSTNTYLKDWAKQGRVKNATVVVAKNQTNGKGQQGARWESEADKNLTFSILYRFKKLLINRQFYLNCAVSLALYDSLLPIVKDKLTIKWPNDIMSANQKLGGILIENTAKSGLISQSVIGIGLNVNQLKFPEYLPNATSLRRISNQEFDLNILLQDILIALADKIKRLENGDYDFLKQAYHQVLYKRNILFHFTDGNSKFKGKIKGVNLDGLLEIELENGEMKTYANKSISFL